MKNTIMNHYGFSRIPFGKDIESADLFRSKSFDEAMAMLQLGIIDEDILLLTGPIGCGKSSVLRSCSEMLDANQYHLIYLRGNSMSAGELYKMILRGLKIEPPHSGGKAKPLFFSTIAELSKKPIVVIDDAQDVSQDALLSIKAMVNFNQDSKNMITFILAGQPELRNILGYAHFHSLRGRIRLSSQLTGMDIEETCQYIDHSLSVAHCKEKIFSDSAKIEIFKRTGGIARHVNLLCYKAIVSGVVDGRKVIDTQNIPLDGL
ncbi:MAG: ExeA family protein [Cyclonatronaceae bacterium]